MKLKLVINYELLENYELLNESYMSLDFMNDSLF